MGTLFDSSEETYLNSFLSSFDVEGLDIAPYVGSPLPMANMSSRTDFASMSLGMGIGAGVMGTMDDVIPHFSLDENPHSLSHGLSHMNIPSNLRNARPDPASSLAQNPGSFFDYGLGGSSHLSLGNVMSEEMRKVSSWLIQNQQQQSPSQSNMPGQLSLNSPGIGEEQGGFSQYPAPVSESDLSIKRKASHDQLNQPRKSRGNMRSPGREVMPSLNVNMLSDNTQAGHALSPRTPTTPAVQRRASEAKVGSSAKRRDSKKALQRTVLTEEERRANHIASEQRRRNQIRQGYAELISLVTTLQDPALGNHPGTAQSTPSKAVILAHTVQFIRGLEEGSRQLRKKLEDTNRELPPMHLSSQALAAFNPSK
ncbi:hypothetical protein IWW50_005532 [Coemansia erecta]|nr:hypothetical protein IWW50_005532 [Coemansia erecta]